MVIAKNQISSFTFYERFKCKSGPSIEMRIKKIENEKEDMINVNKKLTTDKFLSFIIHGYFAIHLISSKMRWS